MMALQVVREEKLLVTVLDGSIHALDAHSGQHLWSFQSGPPLLSTSGRVLSLQEGPPRGDSNASVSVGGEIDDDEHEEEEDLSRRGVDQVDLDEHEGEVFPGADGSLYTYHRGEGLRKLPATARELVQASPSVTRDGAVVLGARRSTVFLLDADTGALLRRFDSEGGGGEAPPGGDLPAASDAAADGTFPPTGIPPGGPPRSRSSDSSAGGKSGVLKDAEEAEVAYSREGIRPLLVMRTDYTVRAVEMATDKERWNVTVSELRTLLNPLLPPLPANHPASWLRRPRHERAAPLLAGGRDNSLRLLSSEDSGGGGGDGAHEWKVVFGAAPTAVFSPSGALVQELLPPPPPARPGGGNAPSAVYLGRLAGQLYALPLDSSSSSHAVAAPSSAQQRQAALPEGHGRVTRTDPPRLPPGAGPLAQLPHGLVPVHISTSHPEVDDFFCMPDTWRGQLAQGQGGQSTRAELFPMGGGGGRGLSEAGGSPYVPVPPPAPGPQPPPTPPPSAFVSVALAAQVAAVAVPALVLLMGALLWLRRQGAAVEEQRRSKGGTPTPKKKRSKRANGGGAAIAYSSGDGALAPATAAAADNGSIGERGSSNGRPSAAGGESAPAVAAAAAVAAAPVLATAAVEGVWVGRLFVSTRIIGYGSHGTLVYEGHLEGRPVAVKRLLGQFYEKAKKEIAALIASDEHPNVVRCFAMEEDADFVYVALERCSVSVADLVHACSAYREAGLPPEFAAQAAARVQHEGLRRCQLWDAHGRPSATLLQLMRDMVEGLAHLHDLGIVHRDVKPQNVLVTLQRLPSARTRSSSSSGSGRAGAKEVVAAMLRAKLSDMGISKRLSDNASSFDPHATGGGGGSSGWQAPEQLTSGRQTRAVDMFALGCVLFFCASGGRHPFGAHRYERDANILRAQLDLFPVEHIPEAAHLMRNLLSPDPSARLMAGQVARHPLLWGPEERLAFLRDASDRVEGEDREENSLLLAAMEAAGPAALGSGPWDERLDAALLDNLGRYRRYNYRSVRDLLRELLGPVPEGYEAYFRNHFPQLLLQVYIVLHDFCFNDHIFRRYFHGSTRPSSS
eukprot:jgi/Mesen1/4379/ME000222S03509